MKIRGSRIIFYLCVLLLPCSVLASFFLKGPIAWISGLVYITYDTVLLLFVTRNILRVLKENRSLPSPTRRPTLAVLIAARNESAVILQCLERLFTQTDPPDSVHLIDDGSTDDTVSQVERHYPQIQIQRKAHSGKADSLNCAWPKIEAEILVTLDADTLLEPTALQAFREAFGLDEDLAAAGGVLTPTCIKNGFLSVAFQTFQRFEYVRAFLSRRAWMQEDALLLVSGAFGGYRKSALEAVGGYNTRSLVEDYDLIHRIHRSAFETGIKRRVAVLPRARATTDVPAGFRPFLKQRERWFAGFLQTHFDCWDMVGNPRYGAVGLWMLPIKSLDTLQPIYGLVAFVTLVGLLFSPAGISHFVLAILLIKLTLDLSFHFWSLSLYSRWQGMRLTPILWAQAAFVSLCEPFTFQLLRHCGATLGWVSLLRKDHEWTPLAKKSTSEQHPVHTPRPA
jgi:cellulose synthase/poly-beta-1,6-N-acetylglucosamine synthase-like glycosyltransferase